MESGGNGNRLQMMQIILALQADISCNVFSERYTAGNQRGVVTRFAQYRPTGLGMET